MSFKDTGNKFEFGTEFQEAILGFVINDKDGYKAIDLIDDSYFALISHAIIFKTLKTFFKKKNRIPSLPIIKENIRSTIDRSREFSKLILQQDRDEIDQLLNKIYSSTSKDGDEILSSIIKFARYVELRDVQEKQNLLDFSGYEEFANKVQKAINIGLDINDSVGTFLVSGAKDRVYKRALGYEVTPTPYWQINQILNGGGFEKGSLIMFMSEAKRFKTGVMINWGLKELGRRRKGFYVDLENGELAISTRGDQSIITSNKKDVVAGLMDDKLLKTYRKYGRLKSELLIKRFPAYRTTTKHIQQWLDKVRLQYGITFDYGIIDYGDLLGASSGRVDDDKRISDAYVDMKNLAEDNNLDYILTASHVKRDTKRTHTKYIADDVAKSIDKIRHCDAVFGLQENEEEIAAGIIRMEVVEIRDGERFNKCLFWADIETQKLKEFTKAQVQEYHEQMGIQENPKKKGKTKPVEKVSDI